MGDRWMSRTNATISKLDDWKKAQEEGGKTLDDLRAKLRESGRDFDDMGRIVRRSTADVEDADHGWKGFSGTLTSVFSNVASGISGLLGHIPLLGGAFSSLAESAEGLAGEGGETGGLASLAGSAASAVVAIGALAAAVFLALTAFHAVMTIAGTVLAFFGSLSLAAAAAGGAFGLMGLALFAAFKRMSAVPALSRGINQLESAFDELGSAMAKALAPQVAPILHTLATLMHYMASLSHMSLGNAISSFAGHGISVLEKLNQQVFKLVGHPLMLLLQVGFGDSKSSKSIQSGIEKMLAPWERLGKKAADLFLRWFNRLDLTKEGERLGKQLEVPLFAVSKLIGVYFLHVLENSASQAWSAVKQYGGQALNWLRGELISLLGPGTWHAISAAAVQAWDATKAAADLLWQAIKLIVAVIDVTIVKTGILQGVAKLVGFNFQLAAGMANALVDAVKTAIDWVEKLASAVSHIHFPSLPSLGSLTGGLLASGGVVHAASGYFQPHGTDTVPAMLTPGEMVINGSQQKRLANLLFGGASGAGGKDVNLVVAAIRRLSIIVAHGIDRLISEMKKSSLGAFSGGSSLGELDHRRGRHHRDLDKRDRLRVAQILKDLHHPGPDFTHEDRKRYIATYRRLTGHRYHGHLGTDGPPLNGPPIVINVHGSLIHQNDLGRVVMNAITQASRQGHHAQLADGSRFR